jgi:type I restriction enzyme, R subunit
MDAQVSELARHSANFGFLARHEPLFAIDCAAAESYVYSDPDAAMVKARRFAETLARELLVRTRINPRRTDRAAGHGRLRRSTATAPTLPQPAGPQGTWRPWQRRARQEPPR